MVDLSIAMLVYQRVPLHFPDDVVQLLGRKIQIARPERRELAGLAGVPTRFNHAEEKNTRREWMRKLADVQIASGNLLPTAQVVAKSQKS